MEARKKSFRQGDVAFFEIEKLPEGAEKTGSELVIEGENPGHIHLMTNLFLYSLATENENRTFVVIPGPNLITHPEHPPLEVPAGTYEVQRAREYQAPNPD